MQRTAPSGKKSIDDIQALRTNDKAYAVPGEIAAGTSWYYQLLKSRFQIEVANGSIAEIKLRCTRWTAIPARSSG